MKKSTRWGILGVVLTVLGYLAAAKADKLSEEEL